MPPPQLKQKFVGLFLDDEIEKLLPTLGFDGYLVSDLGNVYSQWRQVTVGEKFVLDANHKRRLRAALGTGGRYYLVGLHGAAEGYSGKRKLKSVLVHKLVCEAFHGPRPTVNHQVRHLNGDGRDNRACNLAWGTAKENQQDSRIHGTMRLGFKRFGAKIRSVEDILAIKKMHSDGIGPSKIAKLYKCHRCTIHRIVFGKSYKNELPVLK